MENEEKSLGMSMNATRRRSRWKSEDRRLKIKHTVLICSAFCHSLLLIGKVCEDTNFRFLLTALSPVSRSVSDIRLLFFSHLARSDSAVPQTACHAPLSATITRSLFKFMSTE